MVVQHNIMALNAYNRLSTNNASVSKNLEKLSSGYRINRAGDDAAGLAISEKMRAQITGLERASDNAQDGISLVQTAEGALTEVHSMLNRMTELATQSANGTFDNTTDRKNLQKEVESLQSEIDRIADETNFNGINLLDGSLGAAATQTEAAGVDSNAVKASYTIDLSELDATVAYADTSKLTIGGVDVFTASGAKTGADAIAAISTAYSGANAGAAFGAGYVATYNATDKTLTVSQTTATTTTWAAAADAVTIADGATSPVITTADVTSFTNGVTETVTAGGSTTKLDFTGKTGASVAGSSITVGSKTYEFVKTGGAVTGTGNTAVSINENDDATAIATALKTAVDTDTALIDNTAPLAAHTYGTTVANGALTFTSVDTGSGVEALEVKQTGTGLNLQIGDTASQRISVKVDSMDSKSLGVDVSKVNIGSEEGAKNALSIIKTAINTVSGTRADLGAIQNRLEYTVNNLATTTENLTSAESRIRDTDMAKEMMAYTKNNVLSQAAQAMLAQANQQPQSVLQLLQ